MPAKKIPLSHGIFLILLLVLSALQAHAVTVLPGDKPQQLISQSVAFLEDPSHQLRLEDVRQRLREFTPLSQDTYNRGYSRGSHWLHFQLRLDSNAVTPQLRLLEINFPFLWLLDLYVLDGDQLIYRANSGAAFDFSERPFEHANFVFPLQLPSQKTLDVFIRTKNDGPITLPIQLWQSEAFTTYTGWRQTGFGLYFGIMLALALYNFFLFLSIRSSSYLWYTLHVVGIGFINVSVSGFGSQYLWREFPYFGFMSAALFSFVTNYFALQFTRTFLNTPQLAPKLDRALLYLGIMHLGYLLVFFTLPKALSLIVFTLASLISITLILATGIVCYRRGLSTARYFLIGWGIFEITIGIKLFSLMGIIPNNSFTYYAVMLGSICEGLLLALALADQINQLKAEQTEYHQKALAASEESNRLKDEFLATISHELRTPMNGVKGALQLLKKEALPAQAESYVDLAQLSAQDMLALIDSILGFSEIQSGTLRLEKHPFFLQDELAPLLARMQQQAQNKGLKLRITQDIPEREPLLGDASRLLLVFHHLVDNAIKFTHFGSVSIEVKQQQGQVFFKVVDTGIGLDSLQTEKIFSAFSQAEGAFNRRFGGLGIGLSICQRLLFLMQGQLQFDSVLGKGSEFRVQVGFAQASWRAEEWGSTLPNACVMVVEDNPVNMQVLTAMLAKLDIAVVPVTNGEEAIRFFAEPPAQSPKVHLIFMDCQMPIMDGFDATRGIRAINKDCAHLPIIAVTANALSGDRQRCLEAGMNDYIKKPITLEIIRQSLLRWLPDYRADGTAP
jgi:two-component system, sensor histidine kinase LadS